MADKVKVYEGSEQPHLIYKCPGCGHDHNVPAARWNWNGSKEKPTLNPSVRHYYIRTGTNEEVTTCHYFIREGRIEYCGDCPHELANKTVDLPDWVDE